MIECASMKKLGAIQQKALILLLGGLSLGLSYSPTQQFRIFRIMRKEWRNISKQSLERSIRRLYESKLIEMKQKDDGAWELILTEDGRKRALLYNFETLKIRKPLRWDRCWRVVVFDIPETKKEIRDVFRHWLQRLEFYKLQDSVFVHPYDCRDEFEFLVEFYGARKYVRFVLAKEIDNELHLKKLFSL